MSERVLAVGQWLGTENRVREMRYLKTWGWTMTDTTGAQYAERMPRRCNPYLRSVHSLGLRTTDVPERDPNLRPLTPWPPKPADG